MPSNHINFAYMFNLLYSVYSTPNIILPFFAGTVVDHLGPSQCMILFSFFTLLGQMILSWGVQQEKWTLMLVGRFLYGLGGESIGVASSTLNSELFEGQELALAFGINMAVSRSGSVLNNFLSPLLAGRISPPFAFYVGALMNSITVLASFIVRHLQTHSQPEDIRDDDAIQNLNEALLENPIPKNKRDHDAMQPVEQGDTTSVEQQTPTVCIVTKFGPLFWLISLACCVTYGCILPFNNVESGILLQRNYFTSPPTDCTLKFPNECTLGELQPFGMNPSTNTDGIPCPLDENNAPVLPSSIHITINNNTESSWKKSSYIFDTLDASDVDCTDTFWSKSCTKDYCQSQRKATEKTGRIMSIPYIMSIFLAPCLGHVVDRVQQRTVLSIIASLILLLVHMILACTQSSPILPLIQQGIAYALYASVIWPSIPLIIEAKNVGTAFGTIVAIQNIGLATFPMIIASIYNQSHHRFIPNVEYFFAALAACGLITGIVIHIIDQGTGSRLNSSSREDLVVEHSDQIFTPQNTEEMLTPLLRPNALE